MNKAELYDQTGVAMTCRAFEEYEQMFMLNEAVLSKGPILDVASGASSFTAELHKRGYHAVAVDPLYKLSTKDIYHNGKNEIDISSKKLAINENKFVWNHYRSLDHHKRARLKSLEQFNESYRKDVKKEKYIPASLPSLPFATSTYSLVLCNHFLFLYQEQFDYDFHLQAIKELIRVTKKGGMIRIYPLVGFRDEVYPYLPQLIERLNESGVQADITETEFRFLPSASHFLTIYV